jgi:thioesterase domain-containing protein/acyl carrier protein
VLARNAGNGQTRLVAYVGANGSLADATVLRQELGAALPSFMVPADIVVLNELPRNANGKVDREALPESEPRFDESRQVASGAPSDVEAALLAIWGRLLGVPAIGTRDSFFALGGDSLMVLHLFLEIEERFGVSLPVSTLFPDSTVEHLARQIERRRGGDAASTIVQLSPGGSGPPFFCVHDANGDVLNLAGLARRLGPDQAFLGLRAPGIDELEEPLTNVEQMAERYLEQIRRAQPHGPYYLGGYSFGGSVAHEIARRLRAAGEQVGLLVMLDHFAPFLLHRRPRITPRSLLEMLCGAPAWLDGLPSFSREQKRVYLESQLELLKRLGRAVAGHLPEDMAAEFQRRLAPGPVGSDRLDLPSGYRRVAAANYRALRHFAPAPVDCPVLIVRASWQRLFDSRDPAMGWGAYAPDHTVVTVPGNHVDMLREPNVRVLARELASALAAARATERRPVLA